jgi:hypothetical protein
MKMYQDEKIKKYEVERHSKFFTNVETMRMYKAHAASLINRVNTYSGCALALQIALAPLASCTTAFKHALHAHLCSAKGACHVHRNLAWQTVKLFFFWIQAMPQSV